MQDNQSQVLKNELEAAKATKSLQRLTLDKTPMKEPLPTFTVGSNSVAGPYHGNEDRLVIHDEPQTPFKCYAVIDGHGGAGAAIFVQRHLVEILHETYLEFFNKEPQNASEQNQAGENPEVEDVNDSDYDLMRMQSFLEQAFLTLDKRFCDFARQFKDCSGACVLAAVILNNNRLFVANAGDCRAVLVRKSKTSRTRGHEAHPLSIDHKASSMMERMRIQGAGGQVSQGRIAGILEPSRAIGDVDLKTPGMKDWLIAHPQIQYTKLEDGNKLVLATDGVWDVLSNEGVGQLVQRMGTGKSCLQEAATRVVQHARLNFSEDDISCIVLEYSEDSK